MTDTIAVTASESIDKNISCINNSALKALKIRHKI